jgi:hypothetical protein
LIERCLNSVQDTQRHIQVSKSINPWKLEEKRCTKDFKIKDEKGKVTAEFEHFILGRRKRNVMSEGPWLRKNTLRYEQHENEEDETLKINGLRQAT